MIHLSELFAVRYGHSLELNRLTRTRPGEGVAFVSRTRRNNGVSAFVEPVDGETPAPAGNLTVALGGSLLSSFLQTRPFYTGRDVAILRPLRSLSKVALFYYCMCIRANHYRYNYGRQANRTLKELPIPSPDQLPPWLNDYAADPAGIAAGIAGEVERLQLCLADAKLSERGPMDVGELFEIRYGNSYELCNLKRDPQGTNFVSRRTGNNGVSARVAQTQDEPFPAGRLTVSLSGQGGALQTYVQPAPFYTAFHVAVLTPKVPMSLPEKMFYARALTLNRFRYGFGRQANRSLPKLRLPAIPPWLADYDISETQRAFADRLRSVFPH